ncbi:mpv17-like protein 2 [Cimex lectularius]|uniref:Mpv17-like protein 2 n=1 Tax=Cimex lectularius TaxID=79782 RepID=A0A8I6RSQ2_CIMLE|nr:mpv17-like protein 2 [Cimex lectularius]
MSFWRISFLLERARKAKEIMFDRHLFLTNVSISVTLSGVGDLIVQSYRKHHGKCKEIDLTRTKNMSLTGATVGVLCHNWYKYLDVWLPGHTVSMVLKKVVVDQIVFSPVMLTAFFLTLGVLEKSSWKTIRNELVEKGKILYMAEWVVWPPAQVINFYLLPTKYRVLYDNTISLGYDIYTSHIKNDLDPDGK